MQENQHPARMIRIEEATDILCNSYQGTTTRLEASTNRRRALLSILENSNLPGVKIETHPYQYDEEDPLTAGTNIYLLCQLGKAGKASVILEAHYDILNTKSDNALDNTGSILTLLQAAADGFKGIIALTDTEELSDPTVCGAKKLAADIKKGKIPCKKGVYVLSHELCGKGERIWSKSYGPESKNRSSALGALKPLLKNCPFNHGAVLGLNHGIPAAVLGTIPKEEAYESFPPTWNVCHQERDTRYLLDYTAIRNLSKKLVSATKHKSEPSVPMIEP